ADLQVACATGMEAIGTLADKIRLGRIDSAIGGGVDSISDAPVSLSDGARRALLRLNAAKTMKDRLAALKDLRPGHLA
ncbi:acetyl-CoA C-acyltransferase, partial [Micrococcus endophyticus]